MNIGILVAGLPPDVIGGAEIQAAGLAAQLASHHQVTIFTRSATVPADLGSRCGCEVVMRCPVKVRGLRFGADIVSTLVHLAKRRHSIDAIVAYQTVIDGLIGVLAKALFGIPVLLSVRSELEYRFDGGLKTGLLAPFVFRRADRIAVQSERIAREFLGALAKAGRTRLGAEVAAKLCVIPNGVAVAGPPAHAGDMILFVGRLVKVKGLQYLIEAMRDCPAEQLLIVGDGPERAALHQAATGMRNVSFAGGVAPDRVDAYLSRAKVLVVPSVNEGLPNVILEAMARGIPVVASNGGGIPDIVKPDETGFLVPPADSKALAYYIKLVAGDPGLRARLAGNCLAEMRAYRWPVVVAAVDRELARIAPGAVTAGSTRRSPG